MARPPIDLRQRIKDILTHVEPLPSDAAAPLRHYRRSGIDSWNLLDYIERNLGRLALQKSVLERHLTRLNAMLLVSLSENFERFLKEIAAACVDHLAHFVLTLSIVWQIRHSVVHNVGVITRSDAIKLRLLTKQPVESPRTLAPTRDDLRYRKQFLDETAELCNRRVAERLAELLTTIHSNDPGLFDPSTVPNEISLTFGIGLTVAGMLGRAPPPV